MSDFGYKCLDQNRIRIRYFLGKNQIRIHPKYSDPQLGNNQRFLLRSFLFILTFKNETFYNQCVSWLL